MKNILKLLVLTFIMTLVTGCMDFSAEMEIKNDKSMIFTITEMVDSTNPNKDNSFFNDSDVKKYREYGFTTNNEVIDDMVGHVLTKKFSNIDEVSSTEQVYSKDATKALVGESQYIFTVKKGILRNKYYATFNVKDFIDKFNKNNASLEESTLQFKLRLPYKAVSSNATSTSNNGKVLDWDLKNLETDQIYFEFRLFNLTNIYIIGGAVLLIALLIFSERRDKQIARSFYKRK